MLRLVFACCLPLAFPALALAAETPPKPIGSFPAAGIHLAQPRPGATEQALRKRGIISPNASAEETREALQQFRRAFAERSPSWVNPVAQQRALEHETELGRRSAPGNHAVKPVSLSIFGLAVEFEGPETVWQYDADSNLISSNLAGPAQGAIPAPGACDNQTLWYEPERVRQPSFYTNLIVGHAGVGRVRSDLLDPDDGLPGVNLAGYTAQDYFDQMAGAGNVSIAAEVEGWVKVSHCEGFYGAPNHLNGDPDGGAVLNGNNVPAAQLVIDAIAAFQALHPDAFTETGPDAFWPKFDADGDGVLDACWIFHAGKGEEAGGGSQGEYAIWSHSGDLRNHPGLAAGLKIYEGDPSTTNDDIVVGPYSILPENADLGLVTTMIARNFFGLPDLGSDDLENSIGFWCSPGSGSWNGKLGGAAPAPLPLWLLCMAQTADGLFLNWQEPMLRLNHDSSLTNVVLGRLEGTPDGLPRGARINLPPIVTDHITNRLNSGKCAYSGRGRDMLDLVLSRSITVPASATNLTFAFACDIEADWDYGFLLADGISLPDLDGLLTTNNPNGNNPGFGLTGSTNGTLRFDITSLRGKKTTFSWRYKTDQFVTGDGWWVDDIRLDGTLIENFETATPPEGFPNDWSNSTPGWFVAPLSYSPTNFYLVEWRAPGKYDGMLRTAFSTVYADEHDWRVARTPYHLPGALIYHRDARYRDSRWLALGYYDAPSFGPKYQLLLVDVNYRAIRLAQTGMYNAVTFDARVGGFDAALSLDQNPGFSLEEAWAAPSVVTGRWTIPPRPAVATFRDAKGYASGFEANDPFDGYLFYGNLGGSAIIPAAENYSIRTTDRDGNPYWVLYGLNIFGYPLGSGCPAENNAEFGAGVRLLKRQDDASSATLEIGRYNKNERLELSVQKTGTGQGVVRSNDGIILCDNQNTSAVASYVQGSIVSLQAEAGEGSFFAGWSSPDVDGIKMSAVFQLFDHTPVLARFVVPPAPAPDCYRVPTSRSRTVPAPGVLANDLNPEQGRIWAELASGCSTGNIAFKADGSFTYTPPPDFTGKVTFTYRAIGEYETVSTNIAVVTLLVQPSEADFNGDSCSDLAVYDLSSGAWHIRTVEGEGITWNMPWGGPGFFPLCADYTGDGLADIAVYSLGDWYIRHLTAGTVAWAEPWGDARLVPIPGDFDGDGKADLAVYDPLHGLWYARRFNGDCIAWAEPWGGPGFEPMPGDFNADGCADLAVYNRATGLWYVRSLNGSLQAWAEPWGGPGLVPVSGDFDGDGASDLAVYDRATGLWYIRNINNALLLWAEPWGGPGLIPVGGNR